MQRQDTIRPFSLFSRGRSGVGASTSTVGSSYSEKSADRESRPLTSPAATLPSPRPLLRLPPGFSLFDCVQREVAKQVERLLPPGLQPVVRPLPGSRPTSGFSSAADVRASRSSSSSTPPPVKTTEGVRPTLIRPVNREIINAFMVQWVADSYARGGSQDSIIKNASRFVEECASRYGTTRELLGTMYGRGGIFALEVAVQRTARQSSHLAAKPATKSKKSKKSKKQKNQPKAGTKKASKKASKQRNKEAKRQRELLAKTEVPAQTNRKFCEVPKQVPTSAFKEEKEFWRCKGIFEANYKFKETEFPAPNFIPSSEKEHWKCLRCGCETQRDVFSCGRCRTANLEQVRNALVAGREANPTAFDGMVTAKQVIEVVEQLVGIPKDQFIHWLTKGLDLMSAGDAFRLYCSDLVTLLPGTTPETLDPEANHGQDHAGVEEAEEEEKDDENEEEEEEDDASSQQDRESDEELGGQEETEMNGALRPMGCWDCSLCGGLNEHNDSLACDFCGGERLESHLQTITETEAKPQTKPHIWDCLRCGQENSRQLQECSLCGGERDDASDAETLEEEKENDEDEEEKEDDDTIPGEEAHSEDLPYPWILIDGDDGPFYFNEHTGESQWARPSSGVETDEGGGQSEWEHFGNSGHAAKRHKTV